MTFRVKRINCEDGKEEFLTTSYEFGDYSDAKEYDDYLDARTDMEEFSYDDLMDYDYVVDEDGEEATYYIG